MLHHFKTIFKVSVDLLIFCAWNQNSTIQVIFYPYPRCDLYLKFFLRSYYIRILLAEMKNDWCSVVNFWLFDQGKDYPVINQEKRQNFSQCTLMEVPLKSVTYVWVSQWGEYFSKGVDVFKWFKVGLYTYLYRLLMLCFALYEILKGCTNNISVFLAWRSAWGATWHAMKVSLPNFIQNMS